MTTQYIHRLSLVVPVADAAAVRSFFKTFEGGDSETALRSELSATGTGSATHNALSTVITDGQRQLFLAAVAGGAIPAGVSHLITSSVDGKVPARTDAPSELLTSVGLKVKNGAQRSI